MTDEHGPGERLEPAHHSLMEIFEELSFRERVARVMRGLRSPRESGDYKYAVFQLQRLSAPVAALVVPILAVAGLMVFAGLQQTSEPQVEVQIMEVEEVPELDEIEELMDEPLEPPEPIEMDFAPDVTVQDQQDVQAPQDFSPQPTDFDSVAMVKSPVIMKGIIGSRAPGARGSALAEFGGSGITEGAVLRALRWLKKVQEPDGSWKCESGGLQEGRHNKGAPAAMTALGLLTFLAHGETPASEEFGPTVEKAIRWLVDSQNEKTGRFPGNYDIPIATYAACEAFALTKVPMLKDVAERSIDVIIKGQHPSGGWDYHCKQSDRDDTSYMGWCAQALKAAKMAGLKHPQLDQAMRKSIDGFKKNAHPDGGFGYTSPGKGGLTGVGVLCMQLLGASKEPETQKGLMYLEQVTFDWSEPWGRSPMYYWYYITQCKFHAGGKVWNNWNRQFSRELVENQVILKDEGENNADIGYWPAPTPEEHCVSLVYNTCLSALQLQVYYRYLPTFRPPKDLEPEQEMATDQEVEIEITI